MAAVNPTSDRKKVPTYCYQCVNGPDILNVEVVNGVATTVEPDFNAKGYHPADGKICVKPYGLIQKLYNPNRFLKPRKRTNPKKAGMKIRASFICGTKIALSGSVYTHRSTCIDAHRTPIHAKPRD